MCLFSDFCTTISPAAFTVRAPECFSDNTACSKSYKTTIHSNYTQTQPCILSGSLNRVPASAGGKGGDVTSARWHTHMYNGLFLGLPMWAGNGKVKQMWILLKQETVSGSGISRAIRKSASRSRQITTPALHHSDFYRPDALPAAQPTESKHWWQVTKK